MFRRFYAPITLCVAALVSALLYSVFLRVPNDEWLGPIQRILYFHVGSALAAYVAIFAVFVGALVHLATREPWCDALMEAGGELALLFCSIVLATGMIWGYTAWNTPFSFEPRLVTFLLLWFIFLSFNLLRIFGDRTRLANHSAVLGIIGTLTVPLVIYSIDFTQVQLHPKVIGKGGVKIP